MAACPSLTQERTDGITGLPQLSRPSSVCRLTANLRVPHTPWSRPPACQASQKGPRATGVASTQAVHAPWLQGAAHAQQLVSDLHVTTNDEGVWACRGL